MISTLPSRVALMAWALCVGCAESQQYVGRDYSADECIQRHGRNSLECLEGAPSRNRGIADAEGDWDWLATLWENLDGDDDNPYDDN